MKLTDLLAFNPITIQCHDNPDSDAIASGWSLYRYFQSEGKDVRLIYSGRNAITKANLSLMIEKLSIPIEYEKPSAETKFDGLLITVDCQYGQMNVTKFEAEHVAVIDHHQGQTQAEFAEINPLLGSCSTLCWRLLQEVGYNILDDKELCTGLYYGLMTDTGNFAELHHPVDRDMQDALPYDKALIVLFYNSNISLSELNVAGQALTMYDYNDKYKFALVHALPCDPNILGLISDLVLQVDSIDACVVFNEVPDGYKISVRSCVKEVKANEFAEYISRDVGNGGGHTDKAGGFIKKEALLKALENENVSDFLRHRMVDYFESYEVIYAGDYDLGIDTLTSYVKKQIPLGFADPAEFIGMGENITIRTLEGDIDQRVDGGFYIMIGLKGEVYPIKKDKFARTYEVLKEEYKPEGLSYHPTVHCHSDGTVLNLLEYARCCRAADVSYIMAKELDRTVKIFTTWDREKYMLGKPGDFIACRADDVNDIYVIERDIFFKTYDKIEK